MGILIDSSTAVTTKDFKRIGSFVVELITKVSSIYQNVHFGIIMYNHRPKVVLTLQDTHLIRIPSVILGTEYVKGGHRTDLALMAASKNLFCAQGCNSRPDSKNVLIVFTAKDTDPGSAPYDLVRSQVEVSLVYIHSPHFIYVAACNRIKH